VKKKTRRWDYECWIRVRRDAHHAGGGYYGDDTRILVGRDR